MRHVGTRPSKTTRRIVTAASLGLNAAFGLQSGSALGGQPEDELAPLRAEVAVLTARYSEIHPDVVRARHRLEQNMLVVGAWQCLEGINKLQVPAETNTCASYEEGLSAIDMALMGTLMEGRDMVDSTERAQAWSKFRLLISYHETVTRQRKSAASGNAFPRVPRSDWLLLIDALNRAGDFDGARRELSKFESQSPTEWVDCSGPLRGEDFVIFMSARLAAVEEPFWDPFVPFSPQQMIDELSKMFERCATKSLGWSAADVAVWVSLLRGRTPTDFEDPAERATILETFNESRL